MSRPTRVGVVGCGLIAQVMHLPYLSELSDHFEIAALCDVSEPLASQCAARYGVENVHTDWRSLVGDDLDAVMVLTSSNHAPIAIECAQAGLHVFVEKPMALSSADCVAMIQAAEGSGVQLMVGTMKRYDPAYERLGELIAEVRDDIRLARVTTLEAPFTPYVAHYPLVSGAPAPASVLGELERADDEALEVALGSDADEQTRSCYRWILLDNLVHEFNALRGVLGEVSEVVSAELSQTCVSVHLRFGETPCHLSWVDLPGIARYKQEFAFYAPAQRLTLELPSPFLRSMPSRLFIEGGEPDTTFSWEREETVSFDEAFKRELVEFADCIASGRQPRTSGHDGLADLRLCEAVARVHQGLGAELIGSAPSGAVTGK